MLLVLVVALVLSAFFSATEIALVSANKLRLWVSERRGEFGSKIATQFAGVPVKLHSVVLIGNNVAAMLFSTAAAVLLLRLTNLGDLAITLIAASLLLLFGEVIPKSLGRDAPLSAVRFLAVVLQGFSYLFYPVAVVLQWFAGKLVRLIGVSTDEVSHVFQRSDVDVLVRQGLESAKGGDDRQGEIISRIFTLSDRPVREVMVPRTEITAVEIHSRIKEVYKAFIESGYSRLPVYEGSLDKIVGVVSVRDMFSRPRSLKAVMQDVVFVPETKRSGELLKEFRQKGRSLAIVVDEFGGTAGLVTTEDLVEELLGEIHDEYDVEETICREVESSVYLVSGRVEVDRLRREFGISLPEGDYETIGGWVVASLGRIPHAGEEVVIDGFKIAILRATRTKVELLKLIHPRKWYTAPR